MPQAVVVPYLPAGRWCGTAQTAHTDPAFNAGSQLNGEIQMYIGGGILGTLLLVLLIVYLARRV
jgi:hypothetical protein